MSNPNNAVFRTREAFINLSNVAGVYVTDEDQAKALVNRDLDEMDVRVVWLNGTYEDLNFSSHEHRLLLNALEIYWSNA